MRMSKKWLAYWHDEYDSSVDTFETEEDAREFVLKWLDQRRGDAEDGWPLDMRGYVCRIVSHVEEERTEAPESSTFDHFTDYRLVSAGD